MTEIFFYKGKIVSKKEFDKKVDTKKFKRTRHLTAKAFSVMEKNVAEDHRRHNLPLALWKNGKVVKRKVKGVKND